MLGDLQTPIGIYLKVRDLHENSVLLESSDYNTASNSNSFIAFSPLASFEVKNNVITLSFPDGTREAVDVVDKNSVPDLFNEFISSFQLHGEQPSVNGFFGYTAYSAIPYFEDIKLTAPKSEEDNHTPEIRYVLYRYTIAHNLFKNEITIIENLLDGETSAIDDVESILASPNISLYGFEKIGNETSDISDDDFRQMVARGIAECRLGNLSQIVLSRRFCQAYKGDDVMLYRALRSINPSPYLFYFDYGSFRIFGSSPEAHLVVKQGKAYITPIAGTFRRTGDDEKDRQLAEALLNDPKENVEHDMLVELACNDLALNTDDVKVEEYRQVQYYSHVLHLVSKVSGKLRPNTNAIKLFADTFPAGTLSGAPKVKALQLIDELEPHCRGIYGGCIGYVGFDKSFNQAITIRSFLSKNNVLYYQAGAGVVEQSNEESELQEVNNKLGALKNAINKASER